MRDFKDTEEKTGRGKEIEKVKLWIKKDARSEGEICEQ